MSGLNVITWIGIICIMLAFYKIIMKVIDNYDDKAQDPYVIDLIQQIRHIDPKVDEVVDHLRFFEGDKSYTIDKKYVFLCKKDKKTGDQYDKNQLVLVLIHEISHALCDEIGHTNKFDMIFEDLLEKATHKGIYDPNIPSVEDYCM